MRSSRLMLRWGVVATLLAVSVRVFAAAPDISGVWSRSAADASQAPVGPPPLKQKYQKIFEASRQPDAQPGSNASAAIEKCWVEGMPTIMAARAPLEILQTPGQVTVLAEYMGQTRRIAMDEKLPAAADVNPGYMGMSVGKWNADTLEVQTVGVREDVRYQGIPHSGKMKIVEKIHLTGPDELQDELTILDPVTLNQPYRLTFRYKKESRHRVMEYPCKHAGAAAAVQESPDARGEAQASREQPKAK